MDGPRFADEDLSQGVELRSPSTTAIPPSNIASPALAASQAIHSTTRLSYNNGYGDFCFGRFNDRCFQYVNLIDGSAGVPVIELDGYKRTGPFEFFRLPIEIRHRIYRLLLGPFYSYSDKSKRSYIKIYFESRRDPAFSVKFEDFPGNSDLSEDIAKIKKQRYEHCIATHPLRKTYYELKAYPSKGSSESSYDNGDYLLIEWLRQASNTSCLFRKELGDVFWTNAELQMCAYELDVWPLLDMLEERPSTHANIKSLSIALYFYQDSTPWGTEEDFEVWCSYFGRILQLNKLRIEISVEEGDFQDFVVGKNRFSSLRLLQKLHVTGSFGLECLIGRSYVSPEYEKNTANLNEIEIYQYLESLWEEGKPKVRDMLLPDTLRAIEESAQTKYLRSRPQPTPPPDEEPEMHCTIM